MAGLSIAGVSLPIHPSAANDGSDDGRDDYDCRNLLDNYDIDGDNDEGERFVDVVDGRESDQKYYQEDGDAAGDDAMKEMLWKERYKDYFVTDVDVVTTVAAPSVTKPVDTSYITIKLPKLSNDERIPSEIEHKLMLTTAKHILATHPNHVDNSMLTNTELKLVNSNDVRFRFFEDCRIRWYYDLIKVHLRNENERVLNENMKREKERVERVERMVKHGGLGGLVGGYGSSDSDDDVVDDDGGDDEDDGDGNDEDDGGDDEVDDNAGDDDCNANDATILQDAVVTVDATTTTSTATTTTTATKEAAKGDGEDEERVRKRRRLEKARAMFAKNAS